MNLQHAHIAVIELSRLRSEIKVGPKGFVLTRG